MNTFNRKQLLRAAQQAASIAPKNTPKAALKGVLLKAGNIAMTVNGTDLENQVTIGVDGSGRGFEALPDAGKFVSLLTEMTDDEVTLSKERGTLYVKSAFSEFDLIDCDSPESFPLKINPDVDTFLIDSGLLIQSLKRVAPAIASDSARYALTGVKFELDDGRIHFVATDGRRLAVESIDCPTVTKSTLTYVVPAKIIKLMLSGCTGETQIGFDPNTVYVSSGDMHLSGRLVEGRYPIWREVLPKRIDYVLPLTVGTLLNVTRQARVMLTDETRAVEYTFDKELLTAKSCDPVAGKATVKLPIAYDGPKFSTPLDGDFICEMLSVWPKDSELKIGCVKNNTVVQFSFGEESKHLIVPISRGEDQ